MLNRTVAVLAALALAGALGLGWWCNGLRAENARLTLANSTLVADLDTAYTLRANEQAVAKTYVDTIATLRTGQRKSHAALSTAVTANPGWAAQRVPADVAAALGM